MIEERESAALAQYLSSRPRLATSRIAIVEVHRATELANPSAEVREAADRLLAGCLLIALSDEILRAARELTSRTVRTLDAIHLASAIGVEADELLAYDRRMLAAADDRGIATANPGAAP